MRAPARGEGALREPLRRVFLRAREAASLRLHRSATCQRGGGRLITSAHEGRALFDNIRKFLRYRLSSNMGEVLTVFLGVVGAGVIGLGAGACEALVLPLLTTQILWVNRWLWGAIALSALLQVAVVHFPLRNLAFGTAPLSLQQ